MKDKTIQTHNGYIPPNATELEANILGSMLFEAELVEVIVDIITDAEVFYSTPHQDTYRAIIELFNAGQRIDFMTVGEKMKSQGTFEQAGGHYFISKLMENVATTAFAEEHARIVVEKWIKRESIVMAQQIQAKAYNDSIDSFELLDEIGNFTTQITDQVVRKPYVSVSNPVSEVLEETAKLMNKEIQFTGIPTGFRELNRITGGWQKQDLVILAARPSVGKTAFLLNLALNASTDTDNQTPVGIYSLEMGKNQLTQRLMANHCSIPLERIKNGQLTQTEFDQLQVKSNSLSNAPIYIDDTPGLNLIEFRAKARRMVKRHGVGLIIIDYLQLMNGSGKYGSREQEVAQISKGLKHIAKQLNISIIALSQLNRAVENRADSQPKLADLRESGAIEQDADVICFLYGHPKDFLEKNPYAKNDKMLDIAKHRNGKLANFIYKFDGDHQRFHSEDLQIFDVQTPKPEPFAPTFTPTTIPPNLKPIQIDAPF